MFFSQLRIVDELSSRVDGCTIRSNSLNIYIHTFNSYSSTEEGKQQQQHTERKTDRESEELKSKLIRKRCEKEEEEVRTLFIRSQIHRNDEIGKKKLERKHRKYTILYESLTSVHTTQYTE